MSQTFVVNRMQGAGWDPARKVTQQDDWDAHAAMMDQMFDDGFVLLAGPVETGAAFEAMLIVRADSETDVRDAFKDDPWVVKDISRIARIAEWNVRLGSLG